MGQKKCYGQICKGNEIDLNLFGMNQKVCRECKRIYNQKRYKEKKPAIILDVMKWKRANRKKVEGYQQAWKVNNPGKIAEPLKLYYDRIENIIWRMVTTTIQKEMKGFPIFFKDYRNLIGIGKRELWKAIEVGLSKGMNRGNFGKERLKWSIGFKVPVSAFDLGTKVGQDRAFSYLNLQPLWSRSNALKGIQAGYSEVA